MQLFVLLMMIALIMHDELAAGLDLEPMINGPAMVAAVLAAYAGLAAVVATACWLVRRRMDRQPGRAGNSVRRLEMMLNASRALLVMLFIAHLWMGWLVWLRQTLGDWILLNEALALAPPLATVLITWWAYYPVDRRMREAALMRQIDGGEPVFPIWTRWQYVLSQARHQVLLLLVPLLALLTWTQIVDRVLVPGHPWSGYRSALTLAGGLGIFLAAPLMIRHVWDTVPLPDGELRTRLLALCDRYRVRIRQLLLWRTYGGVVNGAVMGLIGPTRYILLTDGLIERLDDDEVEAVMAHELGHVRRHHMPWLAVCAIGILMAWTTLLEQAMVGLESLPFLEGVLMLDAWRFATDGVFLVAMLAGWFFAFGYISRRFERQADAFAVQHLTRRLAEDAGEQPERISERAASIMSRALMRVAELSHASPDRPSWRHGSITWRVDYLRSLVGVPIDACSIDVQVRRLRFTCLLLGAASLAITMPTG